jgi:hypothetical protein
MAPDAVLSRVSKDGVLGTQNMLGGTGRARAR